MADSLDPISSVVAAFERAQLIPDIIPDANELHVTVLFSVIFPTTGAEVVLGSEIPHSDTLSEPDIRITPISTSGDVTYTLLMIDPDAPSRADPKYRQWRHWVITGLKPPAPGSSVGNYEFAIKTKPSTTPYWPPGPPLGSGLHRYTFLLFQEPSSSFSIPGEAPEYKKELQDRRSWNAMSFAQKYDFKLVGANFFLTQATAS